VQGTRLEAARMVSAFVGATLLTHSEATSVLWDGVLPSSKQNFIQNAKDAFSAYPEIPHTVWIGLYPFRDQETQNVVVVSFGLNKFVGREIEMQAPQSRAKTLVERISGLITYLLQHGLVLNDGDTIGISATEKILVHLIRSNHFDQAPVIFATLENTQ
jgi:hypothetical protein